MQAITTKYLPSTNRRPSRIKAMCERGSITITFPHEFGIEGSHIEAAKRLVGKFIAEDALPKPHGYSTPPHENPWGRPFVTGWLPSGNCAHVFLPKA